MARIVKNHSLGKEEAKKRIANVIPEFANRYNLNYRWESDYVVNFEGSGAKGQFVIMDNSIEGELTLGFLLRIMEKQIVDSIQEKLNEVLG